MELQKDFKEFIALLNEHKVKYLVVGGYAVNFHGYPRYTKDIDLWIWLNKENTQKMMKVLKDFGFEGRRFYESGKIAPPHLTLAARDSHFANIDGLKLEKW